MSMTKVVIGILLGAFVGGLVEYLLHSILDKILPATLQKFHIVAISGAIIGLALAMAVLSNGGGEALSGQLISSEGGDIGDNAIIAGGNVIVNNSDTPLTIPAEIILNENGQPETVTIRKGESRTIRAGDTIITVSILKYMGMFGPETRIGDMIDLNISGRIGSRSYKNLKVGQCIHFHPILVTYVKANPGLLSSTLGSASFTVYALDDSVKDTNLCADVTPIGSVQQP
jgi:hypothetical protein